MYGKITNKRANYKSMSKNKIVNEEQIQAFLQKNPNFFVGKDQLLTKLNIPHSNKGAISLIEQQIVILRKENKELKNQLNEFIKTAAANDLLTKKIQTLTIKLIDAGDLSSTLNACKKSLKNDFKIQSCTFILYKNLNLKKHNFVTFVDKKEKSLKSFQSFIRNNQPRCNKLKDEQQQFLFRNSKSIKSCALIPLYSKNQIGFLAIGSNDENRFNPSMSMDYLALIGILISHAITRYLPK